MERQWRHVAGIVLAMMIGAVCLTGDPSPQDPPSTGLETPWDARKIINAVLQNDERYKPLLRAINPQEWYEKRGATSTYVIQWQTAQRQLNDVELTAKQAAGKPDSLSMVLDMYFRLEALELSSRAVDEGAKKYADRATSDQLSRVIAENFDSRQRLREYVRNLAGDLEQNFKIADGEAQRCRGMISKEPLPATRKSNKN